MSDGWRGEYQGIDELVHYATEECHALVFLRLNGGTVSLSQDELHQAEWKLANEGHAHAA